MSRRARVFIKKLTPPRPRPARVAHRDEDKLRQHVPNLQLVRITEAFATDRADSVARAEAVRREVLDQLDGRTSALHEAVPPCTSRNRDHLRSSFLAAADCFTESPKRRARSSSSAMRRCLSADVSRCDAASAPAALAATTLGGGIDANSTTSATTLSFLDQNSRP